MDRNRAKKGPAGKKGRLKKKLRGPKEKIKNKKKNDKKTGFAVKKGEGGGREYGPSGGGLPSAWNNKGGGRRPPQFSGAMGWEGVGKKKTGFALEKREKGKNTPPKGGGLPPKKRGFLDLY